MAGLAGINNTINGLAQVGTQQGLPGGADGQFDLYLNQAMQAQSLGQIQSLDDASRAELIAQVLNEEELQQLEQRRRTDRDQTLPNAINPLALQTNRLEVPPFQLFIDKAVDALENISQLEFRVNDLTEQYIEGRVSIDEVSIEANKLNLAVSFATTVISTASQTLKELTQLAI